ncbi:serine/threonine-protein phosphatase Pgam5, mitochondrial [Drosophila persimilis]|uniref:serine/threonine-protein phosphatase Pgam5, mitochondrial n=1 Tax=Drosophila persimilis TaxID=7234 RepID=UPI000F07AD41|nr:serine/threonine-protein phosphatase Pgam5, mitochondrial [Drosophila persimilis]
MHTLRFRSLVTSTSAWLISHHRSTCEGDGTGIGDTIQPSWVTDWDQDHPHAAQGSQGQKSKYSRHIILVRHGQYEKAPTSPDHLTDLGREQAKWTGKRLREFNITWDQVVVSTMTRAQQTSAIILKELDVDPCKVVNSDELREGAPYFADPPTKRSPPKQEEAAFCENITSFASRQCTSFTQYRLSLARNVTFRHILPKPDGLQLRLQLRSSPPANPTARQPASKLENHFNFGQNHFTHCRFVSAH